MKNTIIVLFLFIVGCGSVLHDDTEWSYASLWVRDVISITDSVRVSEPVVFRLQSVLSNSCWEYGHMNVEVDGDDVHVWFLQKMDMGQYACTEAYVPYEINESISLIPPGEYNFHFWQYGRQSIDTVVIVY